MQPARQAFTRESADARRADLIEATAAVLAEQGLAVETVKKVLEGRPHIVDTMKNGGVQLVFNTTEGKQSLADSFEIRRTALMMKTPYFTTAAGALAAAQAIAVRSRDAKDIELGDSLDARFDRLAADDDVERELARIKAKRVG